MKESRTIIISNPVPATNKSGLLSLLKFIDVISGVYDDKITVISGNVSSDSIKDKNVIVQRLEKRRSSNTIANIFYNIIFQVKAGITTAIQVKKGDIVFFWIADGMILPYIVAKLRGAYIYYFIYGNPEKIIGGHRSEIQTAKRITILANKADIVCAEDIRVFEEWGEKIKNPRRKVIHLYTNSQSASVSKEKIIGMICRISEGKYVKESIKAFEELIDIYPDWKLEIVGSGPLFNECEGYINEKGLNNRILMYGWIESDKKWDIMKKWRFLLFPTDTEGLPNTVIESMSIGLPCIASPVSSITSLIGENERGYYIKENSIDGIAESIKNAISEISYEKKSVMAFEYVNEKYSFENAVNNAKHMIFDIR